MVHKSMMAGMHNAIGGDSCLVVLYHIMMSRTTMEEAGTECSWVVAKAM